MLTILWDNDGVLVDTEGLYVRATRTVLAEVGHRMKSHASDNLNDHHRGRDANYDPRATFCNGRIVSEVVGVTPAIRTCVVH
jgi:phosphoglycolate phosphatase-like HAD superfamily hydrolase